MTKLDDIEGRLTLPPEGQTWREAVTDADLRYLLKVARAAERLVEERDAASAVAYAEDDPRQDRILAIEAEARADAARPAEPPTFDSLPIEQVAVHVAGPKCDDKCEVLHVRRS